MVILACFAFRSLYFTICKNRYTHSLIICQYSVGSSTVKKAKCDGSLFKFFVEQFGNPSNTSSSESLRFDLSFLKVLIEVLHSSKTTVLCCEILTFWSNMALNIVSTARSDLCFPLLYPLFLKPFWIRNLKSPGKSGSARLPRGMKLGNNHP